MDEILFKLVSENGRIVYRQSNLLPDSDIQALLSDKTITLNDETFHLVPVTTLAEIESMANALCIPVPTEIPVMIWPDSKEIES